MANIGLATPDRMSHTRQVSAAPTIASNEGKYKDRNPDMSTVSLVHLLPYQFIITQH